MSRMHAMCKFSLCSSSSTPGWLLAFNLYLLTPKNFRDDDSNFHRKPPSDECEQRRLHFSSLLLLLHEIEIYMMRETSSSGGEKESWSREANDDSSRCEVFARKIILKIEKFSLFPFAFFNQQCCAPEPECVCMLTVVVNLSGG